MTKRVIGALLMVPFFSFILYGMFISAQDYIKKYGWKEWLILVGFSVGLITVGVMAVVGFLMILFNL